MAKDAKSTKTINWAKGLIPQSIKPFVLFVAFVIQSLCPLCVLGDSILSSNGEMLANIKKGEDFCIWQSSS